jgi:hypothetical protein
MDSHLHIDLDGPLLISSGFTHLLLVVNRSTCWKKALPLSSTSAAACALCSHWRWSSASGCRLSSLWTLGSTSLGSNSYPYCKSLSLSSMVPSMFRLPRTTPSSIAMWGPSTTTETKPCRPGKRLLIGTPIFLGFCFALEPLPRNKQTSL